MGSMGCLVEPHAVICVSQPHDETLKVLTRPPILQMRNQRHQELEPRPGPCFPALSSELIPLHLPPGVTRGAPQGTERDRAWGMGPVLCPTAPWGPKLLGFVIPTPLLSPEPAIHFIPQFCPGPGLSAPSDDILVALRKVWFWNLILYSIYPVGYKRYGKSESESRSVVSNSL